MPQALRPRNLRISSDAFFVPLLVRLVDGLLQVDALVVELTADVDVRRASVHRVASDQAALHQRVGLLADDLAILRLTSPRLPHLAGAGLGLIAVHAEEVGTTVLGHLGHEAPLQTGGEGGASTAAETGRLDIRNDLVGTHLQQLLRLIPEATLHGALDVPVVVAIEVCENTILVLGDNAASGGITERPPCTLSGMGCWGAASFAAAGGGGAAANERTITLDSSDLFTTRIRCSNPQRPTTLSDSSCYKCLHEENSGEKRGTKHACRRTPNGLFPGRELACFGLRFLGANGSMWIGVIERVERTGMGGMERNVSVCFLISL